MANAFLIKESNNEVSNEVSKDFYGITLLNYMNEDTHGNTFAPADIAKRTYYYFDNPISLNGHQTMVIDFFANAGCQNTSGSKNSGMMDLIPIFVDADGNEISIGLYARLYNTFGKITNDEIADAWVYGARNRAFLFNGSGYGSRSGISGYAGGLISDSWIAYNKGSVSYSNSTFPRSPQYDTINAYFSLDAIPDFDNLFLSGFELNLSNHNGVNYYKIGVVTANVELY